ncbi:MAG: glycoside hydrolase family 127 protein [Limisphaerales bacterium]
MKTPSSLILPALFALAAPFIGVAAVSLEPLPFKVPAAMPDLAAPLSPAAVYVGGFLGGRIEANTRNRLARIDVEPLLAGFRQKPGVHPWIGEHLGKWMHAGTLAWANSNDATLRAKLDYAVAELIKAQEADGYLGTYPPDKRFGLFQGADWDVWSHKYCLLGLLTYHQYTGNGPALEAARRAGDLLVTTFPARRSILAAGTHVGMAATSVLEPMVLLHRFTGDPRYLDFCRYLVNSWNEPGGPALLASLSAGQGVNQTANAKAYEMLSNLVGLCELARLTGDRTLLAPVLHAWEDVVAHRLYPTGSASQGEHFRDDHALPNQTSAHVAETCVTTTWIQLNQQLLRLTGEARFGGELERTFYNHLAAAQRPDGAQWCYFTSLEGTKPYGPGINCCVSSGPRGMALTVQQAYLKVREGDLEVLAVNLFDPSRAVVTLGGRTVSVDHQTGFPRRGGSTFTFYLDQPATFGFKLRAAEWAGPMKLKVNGQSVTGNTRQGWLELAGREWKNGDRLEVDYTLTSRLVSGTHGNQGKAALAWGPMILAHDSQANPGGDAALLLGFADPGSQAPARLEVDSIDRLNFISRVQSVRQPDAAIARFVPFADAGGDGGIFRVWLRAPGVPLSALGSLLSPGIESRSREGNQPGSIIDGDPATMVVTFDGRPAAEDWFAVNLAEAGSPATKVTRVVFTQGGLFHDGGWFDSSRGKPRIQIQRAADSSWETVGELTDYPATTATNPTGLKSGQTFTLRLLAPVELVALRVIGIPASGDNPAQAFSSCGELDAFAE